MLGDGEAAEPVLMRLPARPEEMGRPLEFIRRKLTVERTLRSLPALDCRKCGFSSCLELAEAAADGKADVSQCRNRSEGRATVFVDGKEVPLGGFVSNIIANTVGGMVLSLKEVGDPREIVVRIVREEKE